MPSIRIVAGGGPPPSPATVGRAADGVGNVLRRLGVVAGEVAAADDRGACGVPGLVTPSRGGLFRDGVALGDEVAEGDRLARIVDAYGETVEEVVTPVAGVVLTIDPLNPAAGTGTWAYETGW